MTVEMIEKRLNSCKEKKLKKEALYGKKQGWIEKKNAALNALGYDYYNAGDLDKAKAAYHVGDGKAFWLWMDIESYQESLRDISREVSHLADEIDGWEGELIKAQQKAASRNVPAIIEFLEAWKQRVMEYYIKVFDSYFMDLQKCREARGTDQYETLNKQFNENCHGTSKRVPYTLHGSDHVLYHTVKDKEGKYEFIMPYVYCSTKESAVAKLERELDHEKDRKYDFIIERTNKIVGEITDASHLRVGEKGDLNGIIYGIKGKAKVQTIGAGGYNEDVIVNEKHGQCFHFRTLIDAIK